MMGPLDKAPVFKKVFRKLKVPAERCYVVTDCDTMGRFTVGEHYRELQGFDIWASNLKNFGWDGDVRGYKSITSLEDYTSPDLHLVHKSFFIESVEDVEKLNVVRTRPIGAHVYENPNSASRFRVCVDVYLNDGLMFTHNLLAFETKVSLQCLIMTHLRLTKHRVVKTSKAWSNTMTNLIFNLNQFLLDNYKSPTPRTSNVGLGVHIVERKGDTLTYETVSNLPTLHTHLTHTALNHTTAKKIEHEVRGHWRTIKTGAKVWIRSHKRGDPTIGRSLKVLELTGVNG